MQFKDRSIKTKILTLTMVVCLSGLVFVSSVLFFLSFYQFKLENQAKASILADVISTNSAAALAFNDAKAAEEVLLALKAETDIISATIYNHEEQEFARYEGSGGTVFGEIKISRDISLDKEVLGKLTLRISLSKFYLGMKQLASSLFIVFVISISLAFAFAWRMQRLITNPILEIAAVTKAVSTLRDYSMRSQVDSADEIGELGATFNRMLSEIEKRDNDLRLAKVELERRVADRTHELETEIEVRKEIEEALRREHQHLRSIIANAPIAIAMFDNDMRYLVHSNKWLLDYGLKESESIIGKSHYEVFADTPSRWKDSHSRALRGEVVSCTEDLFERADGSKLYLRWGLHPWWNSDGSQGGIVMVTDRIDDLVLAREQAIQTMEMRLQFFANISHELRTPMNGVIGFVELLQATELKPEQAEYLQAVQSSGRLMLALINDILDFSKIQSKKLTVEKIGFDFRKTCEEVFTINRNSAVQAGIKLLFDIDSQIPTTLVGDPLRLQQVLMNLVGNALKFGQGADVVSTIRLRNQKDDSIELLFSVKDGGIGIPVEKQKHIFNAFSQVDGSITRKYGGTGLGLAISSQLVELMGGKIWVDSVVGKGSTFSFTLPFRIDGELLRHPVSKNPSCSVDSVSMAGKQILVVEDNPMNQKLFLTVLKKRGLVCTLAENGKRAVEIAAGRKFDIILMDIQMPEMSGLEATVAIRKSKEGPNSSVPIIAITANVFKEDQDRCRTAGMNDLVSKPINSEKLFEVLRRWLASGTSNDDPQVKNSTL